MKLDAYSVDYDFISKPTDSRNENEVKIIAEKNDSHMQVMNLARRIEIGYRL